MATQLKPDAFAPVTPAPFRGFHTKPNIRVAFSADAATLAIRDKMADMPDAGKTLEEIAAGQPFRRLLGQRNAIVEELNSATSFTDDQCSEAGGWINQLEQAIIKSTAATADDAIMKLIAIAQVTAEGHEVEDKEAARVIVDARRFFGIGYVHEGVAPEGDDNVPTSAQSFDLNLLLGKAEATKAAYDAFYKATVRPAEDRYFAIRDTDAGANAIEAASQEHDAAHAAFEALLTVSTTADYDVCHFPVSNAADLRAKLAFMDDRQMGDGMDWTKELLADAKRVAASQGRSFDRAAWDAAWAEHEAAIAADIPIRARYDEAAAAGPVPDDVECEWDASGTRMGDAEWAVFQTPAPDLAALDWKLNMLTERKLPFDDDIAARVIADVRAIRSGVPAESGADAAILDAFTARRREFENSLGRDLTQEESDAYFDRCEAHEEILCDTPATTIAGVVAKLRVAFLHDTGEAWSDLSISDTSHPTFVEGLRDANIFVRRNWSAIEDLARIGGVNLAEQGRAA